MRKPNSPTPQPKKKNSPRVFGNEQELLAARFLESKGLSLIARNYLCRAGEIDLIMQDGSDLVFVEVRFRKNVHYGSAAESVTTQKKRRLIHAAQHYLQSKKIGQQFSCRFDVIAISRAANANHAKVKWIQAAFDLS
jgi:putative endonuclease